MIHSNRRLLAFLATACLAAASAGQEEPTLDGPIHRVAVLGASATAGFGVTVEVRKDGKTTETGMTLADVFKASRNDQDVVFLDLGSGLFFRLGVINTWAPVSRCSLIASVMGSCSPSSRQTLVGTPSSFQPWKSWQIRASKRKR